ncbi:hypothetical protein [Exiguobacterium sp. KJ 601]|uniref:hypothetical protein n=1 Tax=Exiguobacterium sp. KJ 601 TaxID=2782569 RepID=UPI0022AFC1DA|nr:hypothetical protein [Exiguobacterium sp. KJ 601]
MLNSINASTIQRVAVVPVGMNNYNYNASVSSKSGKAPISLESIKPFMTNISTIESEDGFVRFFGIANGLTEKNSNIVSRMEEGQSVVMIGQNRVLSVARLSKVVESPDLSRMTWGDPRYRYILMLKDFRVLDIDAREVTELIYGNAQVIRNLRLLNEENSMKLLEFLDY